MSYPDEDRARDIEAMIADHRCADAIRRSEDERRGTANIAERAEWRVDLALRRLADRRLHAGRARMATLERRPWPTTASRSTVTGGDDAYERKLAQLELFLEDLRTFWPLLVPVFIGWMGAQFVSEGGWGGQTWAPLSPGYAAEKARRIRAGRS
jgi:hypothetical protein